MMRFIYTVKSDLGTVTKKCLLCSIEIYSRLRRYSEYTYTYDLVDQLIVALKRIIFLVPDASQLHNYQADEWSIHSSHAARIIDCRNSLTLYVNSHFFLIAFIIAYLDCFSIQGLGYLVRYPICYEAPSYADCKFL